MEKKICFKDLNGWLKTAVVIAYVIGGIYGLSILFFIVLNLLLP